MNLLTIGCWTFCHCAYLQCQDTLEKQNDGRMTVFVEQYYCKNIGEGIRGEVWGNPRAYGAVS